MEHEWEGLGRIGSPWCATLGMEDYTDLEPFLLPANMASEDSSIPMPRLLVNNDKYIDEVAKADQGGVAMPAEHQKPFEIDVKIPNDAWILLDEMEGIHDSDKCAPQSKERTNSLESSLALKLFEGTSHFSSVQDLLSAVVKDSLIVSSSDRDESLSSKVGAFDDGINQIVLEQDLENTEMKLQPHELADVIFPFDIKTPDVDFTLFENPCIDFPVTPVLDGLRLNFEHVHTTSDLVADLASKTVGLLQESDLGNCVDVPAPTSEESVSNIPDEAHGIASTENTPDDEFEILTVKTNDIPGPKLGKGALLQRKRRASHRANITIVGGKSAKMDELVNESGTTIIAITINQPSTSSAFTSTSTVAAQSVKYLDMRRKNNEASRRSRSTRKDKERDMEDECKYLEIENARLREKADEMEKLRDKYKADLINMLKNK